MSTLPGTSCLLTDPEDLWLPARPASTAPRQPRPTGKPLDPGDDMTRARLAETTGRRAETCCTCGVPLGEISTRRSKSGKAFCRVCADRLVAVYYARHPEARAAQRPGPGRERTGTAYLQERERYAVRYHAGNARWQISDTQARRWTRRWHATEAGADAMATTMNAAWREQIAFERLRFSARADLRAEGL